MPARRLPVLVLLLALGAAAPARAQGPPCDPATTPPTFRGEVPRAEAVIGFALGAREVTTAQSDAYLTAVDRASPRVVSGTLARSVQGRPLRYAIVGRPRRLSAAGLAAVRSAARLLQEPGTPVPIAAKLVRRAPAIVWIAANVHGGEKSGTDAALRVLYELADRSDCAAQAILANALVVILPTQNPDGRQLDTRQNAYGFDLNRDWFARTQPETDGKLEMLRRYPPVLFVDAHEMGRRTYFFPPNADPVYHEITDASVGWINDVYGRALAAEFTRRDIPFFNRDLYDLFYMGYGDTVPTTAWTAAGMTFEKAEGDPIAQRTLEQYVAQWVVLSQAARRREAILRRWRLTWVEARRQGAAGRLEPNEVENPGHEVSRPVPENSVRSYFLRADEAGKSREVRRLVRRLQRMDVRVLRLTQPLLVPDFRAYGRAPTPTTLPAGTYWIPLAQRQKHWAQAMLHEDTYAPFPYFYDVTAWSQPLLFNVSGGYSGAELAPAAERARALAEPSPPPPPAQLPRVGVLRLPAGGVVSLESVGWLRWLLDEWSIPLRELSPSDVVEGGLRDVDVLLVPDGPAAAGELALGPAGRGALTAWVADGGRYVGWRGGTELAARLGLTAATLAAPNSDVPGALVRVRVDPGSPLGRGVGPFAWTMLNSDLVMRLPGRAPLEYPPAGDPDFFISGFARGAEEVGGTAAAVDERLGAGRVSLFAFEPNFRGYTDGTQRLVRNAMLGPLPAPAARAARAAPRRARVRTRARRLSRLSSPLRLTVRPASAARARAILRSHAAAWEERPTRGAVRFTIANPNGLHADQHPWAAPLGAALRRSRVEVLAYIVP